ncbi:class I SAM-dependent methyltransferase [Calothrix membranacea FACHB-236]|nr:class I SAM-dependent methyltransferase [Calothrix membranacea FACHB-236]
MNFENILERIKNVYQDSVKSYHHGKQQNEYSQIDKNIYFGEIDGNYLLFFNEIYRNSIRKLLKNILKIVAWPILKRQVYFNSAIRELLYKLVEQNYEYKVREKEVNEKFAQLEEKVELISKLEQRLEEVSTKIYTANSLTNRLPSLEEAKKKSGLWFNDPILLGYREDGEAYWVGTTERILEKNFVIHSLANLYNSKQINILDVGSAESLLSYELASFNYSVTAIDIRPIALFHPNLKFVKSDICQPVLPPASFDCVVALSTIEHIGLGWYGDEIKENYDIDAIKQIYALLKPEGHFILTVPYGKEALTPVHRIYNQESLQRLIQDFQVIKITYGIRKDNFTLVITDNELEASEKEHNPNNYLPGAVAMLVCKKNIV